MVSGREALRVVLALLPLPTVVLLAVLLGTPPEAPKSLVTATTTPGPPEPLLREELLAAYERSRRATWLVEFEFTRRLRNGAALDLTVIELNRPPDHLIAGLGGLNGRVGGRQVVCDTVEGSLLCAPEGPVVPFEEDVANQVSELRDVLQPPAKWYAVAQAQPRTLVGEPTRCFALRRIVEVPAPPYGLRTEYCFALADGTRLFTRVQRQEGTDQQRATAVRRQVSEADIAALLAGEAPVASSS